MNKFDIKKIYEDIELKYNTLLFKKYNNKFNYYIFSYNDFFIFLYNNKNIYLKIQEIVKRYDNLDIFFYLTIKKIEFNDNIHIVLITTFDDSDFIGFFSTFFDIYKKYGFGEHFIIKSDYRNLGIGTLLLFNYINFYFKFFSMPFYGIILKNNIPSLRVVEKIGFKIYDDSHKIKNTVYITKKMFKNNKKNLKKLINQ